MAQKKLERFAAIKTFANVLEYPQHMQGKWAAFFNNSGPLVLELACGKGEYAVGLARTNANVNYIGVDLKGNRIWVGAQAALKEKLRNVAFIRSQIDKVNQYFATDEVSEIWITFPDPQLRTSKAKKRLTHPAFLRLYHQFLKPAGIIHLKTDSPDLFLFTKTVIELYEMELLDASADLYALPVSDAALQIQTHYEKLNISRSNKVHYLKFRLPEHIPAEKDAHLKDTILEQETARRGA